MAIDISTEMIAIAKQKAAFNGLQNIIEYRETEAEDLVLPDFIISGGKWLNVRKYVKQRLQDL